MLTYKFSTLLIIISLFILPSKLCLAQSKWDVNSIVVTDDFSNNLPLDNGLGSYKVFYTKGYEKIQELSYYDELTNIADSLLKARNYSSSVIKYELAFKENNNLGKVIHRINAAACYTQLNKIDNAFYQLFRVTEKGLLSNKFYITDNELLDPLHSDKRWKKVLEIIEMNKIKRELISNGEIINIG